MLTPERIAELRRKADAAINASAAANRDLIIKMRNALPALLAAVREGEEAKRELGLCQSERDSLARYWCDFQEVAQKVLKSGVKHTYDCFGVTGSCKCGLDDLKEVLKPRKDAMEFEAIRNAGAEWKREVDLRSEVERLKSENEALKRDRERVDAIERETQRVNWEPKSWICVGSAIPQIVNFPVGDSWLTATTQPTARAAIDEFLNPQAK